MGECIKEDGSRYGGSELEHISSVDNEENCLKQCFLKEGAKGCNWFSNFEQCFAVMKTVGSSNNVENITCWRFITGKGKSQY